MELNKKWGPYLSDRQWGVVREDYSPKGDAWDYTTHDQARSKAWRWGEEGIGGISDEQQFLCFAPAFWNGRDPILKERLFGLPNSEGNHGEDVKELYYYLDSAPDHRYMRMLYKYPHAAFPYEQLEQENRRRGRQDGEYEILETGIFDENRYFDIFIEYAKSNSNAEILVKITACNRGEDAAELTILPTIWFRNLWAFGLSDKTKPILRQAENGLEIEHPELGGAYILTAFMDNTETPVEWLFCENESNIQRLFGVPNTSPSCKDGINDFITRGHRHALNNTQQGTKAAAVFRSNIPGGGEMVVRLQLSGGGIQSYPFITSGPASKGVSNSHPFTINDFESFFTTKRQETDAFYAKLQQNISDPDLRNIQRQAWSGMLWSKQFYHYHIPRWLHGDPGQPAPPRERLYGRNHDWPHFESAHILSMPDKWEYPWFAAWDLAFHCVVFARLDPEFAKDQLRTLHSETFRRADGSVPAYEWNFNDVNPPVQAWAAWRIFETEKNMHPPTPNGNGDRHFLAELFPALRAAYDWWLSQKDADGNDLFGGGFLGLDNIGVFDRSQPLPDGARLEQADATAWAAFYSLQMLRISLELAKEPLWAEYYQQQAFDFFQHFLQIAYAIGSPDDQRTLWDDADGFFYDTLRMTAGHEDAYFPLKVRSAVGLLPLFAVLTLDERELNELPLFKAQTDAFLTQNPDLASMVSRWHDVNGDKRLLSVLRGHRTKCLLKKMLDPAEFLSDHGVRSLSKFHLENPFEVNWLGQDLSVTYLPAESDSGMFGGNSNWRGPVWMPVNFLLVESLREFHRYYSDDFRVECPVGSGQMLSLAEVADLLSARLLDLFKRDENGKRALHGSETRYAEDPNYKDLLLFYEYFDGDSGRGVGASHQTGWTGLVAELQAYLQKK
ncbi:MAG: glucosidase [Bacteroidota bacterium]